MPPGIDSIACTGLAATGVADTCGDSKPSPPAPTALTAASEPAKRWFGELGGDPLALDLGKLVALVTQTQLVIAPKSV